jgi:hypothetical protein
LCALWDLSGFKLSHSPVLRSGFHKFAAKYTEGWAL